MIRTFTAAIVTTFFSLTALAEHHVGSHQMYLVEWIDHQLTPVKSETTGTYYIQTTIVSYDANTKQYGIHWDYFDNEGFRIGEETVQANKDVLWNEHDIAVPEKSQEILNNCVAMGGEIETYHFENTDYNTCLITHEVFGISLSHHINPLAPMSGFDIQYTQHYTDEDATGVIKASGMVIDWELVP